MDMEAFSLSELRDDSGVGLVRHRFCDQLKKHSFAVVTLDDTRKEIIRSAYEMAYLFFVSATKEQKEATKKLFYEFDVNKGLVGYNQPTIAKEVFRIRRGKDQPWPQLVNFKETIGKAFFVLEEIIECCMRIVSEELFRSDGLLLSDCSFDSETGMFSNSPFDLFHYFNSQEAEDCINCSRHVGTVGRTPLMHTAPSLNLILVHQILAI